MAQRVLEELSPHECYALLGQARVGRLVYEDELGPVAVPVNYAMAGTDIVVRVEGGTKRLAMEQPTVAFEVDHVDEDERSGWSVIARGSGTEVEIRDVPALLRRIDGDPHVPWAVGIHNVWLQLTPHTLTGRRLGVSRTASIF
jgi:hypothetical protein